METPKLGSVCRGIAAVGTPRRKLALVLRLGRGQPCLEGLLVGIAHRRPLTFECLCKFTPWELFEAHMVVHRVPPQLERSFGPLFPSTCCTRHAARRCRCRCRRLRLVVRRHVILVVLVPARQAVVVPVGLLVGLVVLVLVTRRHAAVVLVDLLVGHAIVATIAIGDAIWRNTQLDGALRALSHELITKFRNRILQ